MQYFELTCKVYIKNDLHYKESFHAISKYVNFSLAQDPYYEPLVKNKSFKPYCFGAFYPIKKSKTYKRGSYHQFTLRSIDEMLIDVLSYQMCENTNNNDFQVTETRKRIKDQFFVTELYSATPVIVSSDTNEKGHPVYWTMQMDGDMNKLQSHLHHKLIDKYNNFYHEDIDPDHNFIDEIELKNRVPQNIHVQKQDKGHTFFGNKFKIVPKEDETSQKLAFLALSVGLGEKEGFGGGFCLWK